MRAAPSGLTRIATISAGKYPAEIALSVDGRIAYVTNLHADTVTTIDTSSNAIIGSPIPVGTEPNSVAVSPDGRWVYVTNNKSNNVSVIDAAKWTTVATVPVGDFPDGLAVDRAGRVYVANAGDETLSVLEPGGVPALDKPLRTGSKAYGIAVNPDGSRVYLADYDRDAVSVFEPDTRKIIALVAVGDKPVGIELSHDGKNLYVANSGSDTVSTIDTATNTVEGEPAHVGLAPIGLASSADDSRIYVAERGSNRVTTIIRSDRSTTEPVKVDTGPVDIAVSPGGDRIYVAAARSDAVTVLATR
jgi:YVTN family beta-propeller protein